MPTATGFQQPHDHAEQQVQGKANPGRTDSKSGGKPVAQLSHGLAALGQTGESGQGNQHPLMSSVPPVEE